MPINFAKWPPTKEDTDRRARYAFFERLFDGDYKEAFAEGSARVEDNEERVYLGADWAALITKVSADMLFGEQPIVSAGDDQKQLDQLLKEVGLFATLAEAALSQSFRGDAVVLLEWDKDLKRPTVTEIPADNYFVLVSRDNPRKVLEQAIAWEVCTPHGDYVRVDRYLPGKVVREAYKIGSISGATWKCDADGGRVSQRATTWVELSEVYKDGHESTPSKETIIPIGRSPIFHAPNIRHGGKFWGISDYSGGLPSLFDAYNERITELHEVISEHSDPKLLAPEGVLDDEGKVKKQNLGVIEIPNTAENGDSFKYLIWDGQLIPASGELKLLEELIFKFSETSPAIFGSDKAGSIESGRAMKFRFQRTLAKIARKVRIWDPILKELIYWVHWLAHKMECEITYADQTKEKVKAPTHHAEVAWQNGLPQDMKEQIEIEEARVRSQLSSRNGSLRRLDGISQAKADEELDRRHQEDEKYGWTQQSQQPDPNADPAPGSEGQPAAGAGQRKPVLGGTGRA